ncbi:hypothetical protein ACFQV2_07920 [Actinokineospora soli]|uniref:Uncharacterized protein n=1 Tax=Actinokineospora soli TaxID=1048753 RepID=A0ABW2TIG2_9PSEU
MSEVLLLAVRFDDEAVAEPSAGWSPCTTPPGAASWWPRSPTTTPPPRPRRRRRSGSRAGVRCEACHSLPATPARSRTASPASRTENSSSTARPRTSRTATSTARRPASRTANRSSTSRTRTARLRTSPTGSRSARPPAAGRPRQQAPEPPRRPEPSRPRGRRVISLALGLAILGALVLLASVTVLPWVDGGQSLVSLWDDLGDLPSMGFGDWYVLIAGAPLAALGVLLSFAAVLESVAMKVIWVALTVLGLGYVAFRYGIGPLTGMVGDSGGFSLAETAVAAGALVAIVVVLFVLKSAVGMFRRIAGLILLGLSGVHISALVDLVGANGFGQLSTGAYGPAVGYLLAGAAAFVTPRRLVPGL